MIISATYKELSLLACVSTGRKISIQYDSNNSFSLHTKEGVLFFSLDIDWYFTLIKVESNNLLFKVSTSGWASKKGLKSILGNKYGVTLVDDVLTVDIQKLRPYKYRFASLEEFAIMPDSLKFQIKIESI